MKEEIIKCDKCNQEIKPEKPDLKIGQQLWACLGFENNNIKIYEVAEGTNKRSLRLKCFDDDGTSWYSTGYTYKDINSRVFLSKEEALKNPLFD